MGQVPFTILDEGRAHDELAHVDGGSVRLDAAALERALGWKLEPQGLCRGDVCMPTGGRAGLVSDGCVDLAGFASLTHRPLALDLEERVAALGASAAERGQALRGGIAPDFSLPDLAGREWTLSGFRGKKVLLIAYASW